MRIKKIETKMNEPVYIVMHPYVRTQFLNVKDVILFTGISEKKLIKCIEKGTDFNGYTFDILEN